MPPLRLAKFEESKRRTAGVFGRAQNLDAKLRTLSS